MSLFIVFESIQSFILKLFFCIKTMLKIKLIKRGNKNNMAKIIINDLTFYYTKYFKPVFEHVNLNLYTDWKLGLIGRNGRGKSTFLKLLSGTLQTSNGTIIMDVETEVFPYKVDKTFKKTIDVIKENIAGLRTMEIKMDEIIDANDENRMEEYQELLSRYLELDGYNIESKIRKELFLMQLSEELLEQDYELLSGGEKTKMQIIALFLKHNTFILLDEPTNHLDIAGKQVMAQYLKQKKGFIIASHDRDFLDLVIDHVLSINKSTIELEKGNYSSWKQNKDQKEAFEFRTQDKLTREIKQLENSSERSRSWAGEAGKQKATMGKSSHARTNGARAFMRQAKRAEENIEASIEEKKQLLRNYEIAKDMTIFQEQLEEQLLIKIKNLSFSYDNRVIFNEFNLNILSGDRIWIRGKNGSGKSTLLRIIAGDMEVDSEETIIERLEGIKIVKAYQDPLWTEGKVEDLVKDKDKLGKIMELCDCFDLDEETLKRPIESFSGGELRKLDMARALSEDNQLLLLDEPLNFMDVYFREQLEEAILKSKPTIVFVEHDERFGKNVATKFVELKG